MHVFLHYQIQKKTMELKVAKFGVRKYLDKALIFCTKMSKVNVRRI